MTIRFLRVRIIGFAGYRLVITGTMSESLSVSAARLGPRCLRNATAVAAVESNERLLIIIIIIIRIQTRLSFVLHCRAPFCPFKCKKKKKNLPSAKKKDTSASYPDLKF